MAERLRRENRFGFMALHSAAELLVSICLQGGARPTPPDGPEPVLNHPLPAMDLY